MPLIGVSDRKRRKRRRRKSRTSCIRYTVWFSNDSCGSVLSLSINDIIMEFTLHSVLLYRTYRIRSMTWHPVIMHNFLVIMVNSFHKFQWFNSIHYLSAPEIWCWAARPIAPTFGWPVPGHRSMVPRAGDTTQHWWGVMSCLHCCCWWRKEDTATEENNRS